MREDENEQCGYKWFNCNRLLKPWESVWRWHDRVTSKGSFAEKIGIPDEVIVRTWADQIDEVSRTPDIEPNAIQRLGAALSKPFIAVVNRFFYDPEKPKR